VPDHARAAVHLGATSQDILDTALMLLAVRATRRLTSELALSSAHAAELAERHRSDVMLGRTLLQPAVPITFGLKAAGWLSALDHAQDGLRHVSRSRALVQLGGAAGTLAALGTQGLEVAHWLAEELGLGEPSLPWHTFRAPVLEWTSALAVTGTVLGKIARDVGLLAQAEVAELTEGGSRGGSSTMPHKQNPVAALAVLACTRRLPGLMVTLFSAAEQEHERALGGWHAEWEPFAEVLRLTGSAASWTHDLLGGLQVNGPRMRANLEEQRGLPLAEHVVNVLAASLGYERAQALVKGAVGAARAQRRSLLDLLSQDPSYAGQLERAGVTRAALVHAFDPSAYLGATEILIDRALVEHAANLKGDNS
jgi:3-carboxy-cis,cis-muconate cycloisomerase